MQKIILVTGATDGIGFETAKMLINQGHHVLVHGRSAVKVEDVIKQLSALDANAKVEGYLADLSEFSEVKKLATEVTLQHKQIDAIINNAGVFSAPNNRTSAALDLRFMVNTIAPYLLTKMLMPILATDGRVVNLSSAAQAPIDINALVGQQNIEDFAAYAQSKLALTAWTYVLGTAFKDSGPMIVAVNPKSLLASKMVKTSFGVPGSDITVGADILTRAALSDEFADAHGKYYDNDIPAFAPPHPDGTNATKAQKIVDTIEEIIQQKA